MTSRRILRLVAAVLCAACAAVYFAIGLGLIYPASDQRVGLLVFGVGAGLAFTLGTVLLIRTDTRLMLLAGVLFQAFAIVMYFQVSGRRDPHFEIWGLSLKAVQAVILVVLIALLRPFRAGGAVAR